ncbi:hypothetical protein BH24GEM3_BH24GEM3_20380 [soil metagenome]|nr:hypothetical protein [Gemmatimonadota bacterium]
MSQYAKLLTLLRYLWENTDELLAFLQRLPAGLRAAGTGMEAAGEGARMVGQRLGGDDGTAANAATALQQAAEAIEQAHRQLQAVAREIRGAADALDQIRVPVVTPVKRRFDLRVVGLGEQELVTGLTIGEQSLGFMANVTGRIRSQAGLMEENFGGQLQTAAERLGQMSQTLQGAGNEMRTLGESLREGGSTLKQLGA